MNFQGNYLQSKTPKSMMRSNSEEQEASCVIDMQEVDVGVVAADMQNRISKFNPKLRGEPAVGKNSCCIFRLTSRFNQIKGFSYMPDVVSIGPIYPANFCSRFREMEELKWECLAYLVNTSKKDLELERYLESIRPLEREARDCYSEKIDLNPNQFLQMMVLDGCFIIQFLRFSYSVATGERPVVECHPLGRIHRVILQKIYADLLLLGNQIPYFVLEQLFEISMMSSAGTNRPLSFFCLEVFSAILGTRYYGDRSRFHELKFLHLLDLVRSMFISPDSEPRLQGREVESMLLRFPQGFRYRPFDTIPSISKLHRAGIKVNPRKKDKFLVVEFQHGVIEMPVIILNNLMCSFLMNCVAFEQCHNNSLKHFSVYALFLDCLVNKVGDVEYLCDHRVIENYMENDAASFINNLGKGMTYDWDYVEFFMLCNRVNVYYEKRFWFYRHWTSFKGEYFDKPWLCLSVLAGLVLLLLTCLQTYYTMNPKH